MREIHNQNGSRRQVNDDPRTRTPAPVRKRRLNKKKFTGALIFFVILIAFGAYGVHYLMTKWDGGKESSLHAMQVNGDESVKLVVLDAGHGGFDPGAMGASGTREADLNLKVANYLMEELEESGLNVIMTRSDENAIAETKDEDMAKRQKIIKDNDPDIVISIHMNSLEDHTVNGPIVLFQPGSTSGEELAMAIQDGISGQIESPNSCTYRSEDLFVLRGNSQPSVLVECGFISNVEEEEKLTDDEYQKQFAKAICQGVEGFFQKGDLS